MPEGSQGISGIMKKANEPTEHDTANTASALDVNYLHKRVYTLGRISDFEIRANNTETTLQGAKQSISGFSYSEEVVLVHSLPTNAGLQKPVRWIPQYYGMLN